MRFINSSSTDAGFNLAAEEYLLKQGTEDVFMLWQSAPSVIIGKHQRVETEVNRTMAEQNKIPVFRRFSGGGAVYHDLGNINLTFIETTRLARFETYLERTIEMLTAAGVAVRGDERLGIYADGRKVSGSAQCVHRNRAMYHCTLLYDTNLVLLNKLLEVEGLEEKVAVHPTVRSVRSEVTNLKEYMHPALSTDKFREWVFRYLQVLRLPKRSVRRNWLLSRGYGKINTTSSVTDVNITKQSDYSVSGGGELFSFQNSAFSYEKCISIFHLPPFRTHVVDYKISVPVEDAVFMPFIFHLHLPSSILDLASSTHCVYLTYR